MKTIRQQLIEILNFLLIAGHHPGMIPEDGSLFDESIRQDEQDKQDKHEDPVDPVKKNENDSTATY